LVTYTSCSKKTVAQIIRTLTPDIPETAPDRPEPVMIKTVISVNVSDL